MRTALVLAAAIAATVFAGDALAQQRGQGRGGPGGSPARGSEDGGPAPMQREATESDAGALLDQELVTDPARLEAARTKAAQQPPTTEDVNVLTRFYAERGEAARMAGNQQQALQDFRKAITELEANNLPLDQPRILLQRVAIANNLRFQGRLNEAENDARLALAAAQRETGVNSLPTARALFALALVLSDQGRAPEAEGLARRSMELLQATGMQTRGGAQQALANILAAQGKWPEAMAAFDTMRQAFQSAPD